MRRLLAVSVLFALPIVVVLSVGCGGSGGGSDRRVTELSVDDPSIFCQPRFLNDDSEALIECSSFEAPSRFHIVWPDGTSERIVAIETAAAARRTTAVVSGLGRGPILVGFFPGRFDETSQSFGDDEGFLYKDGEVQTPFGPRSQPNAVSSDGHWVSVTSPEHGLRLFHDLLPVPVPDSITARMGEADFTMHINSTGAVAGTLIRQEPFSAEAFLVTGEVLRAFPPAAGTWAQSIDLNDRGLLLGNWDTSETYLAFGPHATPFEANRKTPFVFSAADGLREIPSPGSATVAPAAMNAEGYFIGQYQTIGEDRKVNDYVEFVHSPTTGYHPFAEFLNPEGLRIQYAMDINARNEVLAIVATDSRDFIARISLPKRF